MNFYPVHPLVVFSLVLAFTACDREQATEKPNILWITAEDHGPHLGAYGDPYAHTPTIDAFAEQSLRYDIVWSNAPVCAPARTALITGVYPPTLGGQHMRSDVTLPRFLRKYPPILRDAGYYTTNNSKEDYNISGQEQVWDDSSPQAHYRNRKEGQPFFAIFNFIESHESRIRNHTELPYHDPDLAPLPPYHPDTPETRRDWAQYYHGIYQVDEKVREILEELEERELADETIVFFYSDHGSGMPGHKRWANNRGLHVPLIIHIPDKYRHLAPDDYRPGGSTRRPVSFVDLAPTLLSLIGVQPPEWMQGDAFMGHHETEPREYLFGFRDRMDERIDMIRSVRNDRYVYIRNYMPHKIYGQYLAYMWITETTRVWERMYHDGELEAPQTYFWETKPAEELYDLETDPYEVNNLARSEDHKEVLEELRAAHREHVMNTRDTGFLPEAEMHRRSEADNQTIYEIARDKERYPLEDIFETARLAANRDIEALPNLFEALRDSDPAVRYWAVTGIQIRGAETYERSKDRLRRALNDSNPSVRVAAAETLVRFGTDEDVDSAVNTLLELSSPVENGAFISIAAMNVLSDLDETRLEEIRSFIREMPVTDPDIPDRPNDYVHRLVDIITDTAHVAM